jgi:hypothetical protein
MIYNSYCPHLMLRLGDICYKRASSSIIYEFSANRRREGRSVPIRVNETTFTRVL